VSDATVRTTPEGRQDVSDAWERAYLRFETPAEEQRKFTQRLRAAGADAWRRDALILDLFSGRGGGAQALRGLGFSHVLGLDLSSRLLLARGNAADCSVADCRELPIASRSIDIAIVHGGLHHLARLPDDLSSTLREVARVLRPEGIFMAVEPWRTPFLDLVHWLCARPIARHAYSKIDALATMIELERATYEAWLESAEEILAVFDRHFVRRQLRIRLGKLHYVGVPR
jgi:SAM-dependent methyltransferase